MTMIAIDVLFPRLGSHKSLQVAITVPKFNDIEIELFYGYNGSWSIPWSTVIFLLWVAWFGQEHRLCRELYRQYTEVSLGLRSTCGFNAVKCQVPWRLDRDVRLACLRVSTPTMSLLVLPSQTASEIDGSPDTITVINTYKTISRPFSRPPSVNYL